MCGTKNTASRAQDKVNQEMYGDALILTGKVG